MTLDNVIILIESVLIIQPVLIKIKSTTNIIHF